MITDADFLRSARALTEEMQSEHIRRNLRYLNITAEGAPVAVHVAISSQIGWVLGQLAVADGQPVDPRNVTELVLWHDTEETRIWDLGRDVRRYIEIDDERALADKFAGVSWGAHVIALKHRFEHPADDDLEALLARDSDVMYVILTIKQLDESGVAVHEVNERIARTAARLKTSYAQRLAEALTQVGMSEWWDVMMGYARVTEEGTLERIVRKR